jgi:putative peptidoglycan lipid II flippase
MPMNTHRAVVPGGVADAKVVDVRDGVPPPGGVPAMVDPTAVVRHSLAGSVWTVVSRLTGLLRVVVVGAVLGATYLGNTYQTLNSIPNLVFYQFLAGSVFVSLLVPPLVRSLDDGDRDGARRVVQGFLGTMLLIAAGAAILLLALAPVIMRLLTMGATPATAAAQRHVGWLLLGMFVPQILLYTIIGTAAAVMNAHGRFALAAGAPSIENLGIIAVLLLAGVVYGTGIGILDVSDAELVLLGVGTTAAVGLHATCQWLGARASGERLVPSAGWRDPRVRQAMRSIGPVLAYSALSGVQVFAVMIAANTVAGGYVGFQVALNFFYLPTAIVTWPMARALVPALTRLYNAGRPTAFRDEFLRGVALATFLIAPIAAAYIALSPTLARAMAFGQLDRTAAVDLIAISLATLAPGILFETWFILGSYALYARYDARSPFRAMLMKVGSSLLLMVPVWFVHSAAAVLCTIGLSLTFGSSIGAASVGWPLRRQLPEGSYSPVPSFLRTLAASSALVVAAYGTAEVLDGVAAGHVGDLVQLGIAALVSMGAFLLVQVAFRAPELGQLRAAIAGRTRLSAEGGRAGG